jgi:Flp pilus assembly pilin Flp
MTMLALRRTRCKLESLWLRLAVDRGQTLAEYGILVTVIAVVVIVAALVLGSSVSALFSGASRKV